MEYEKIKSLMEDMSNSKLTDFDIEFSDGTKISMKKSNGETVIEKRVVDIKEEQNVETISEKKDIKEEKSNNNFDNKKIIKSPMVGTFYSKPSPTQNPYVEIGKNVKKGDVVCIVEAMKLMNEIETEYDGKIAEILIKDGEMVEYGTPLFVIE